MKSKMQNPPPVTPESVEKKQAELFNQIYQKIQWRSEIYRKNNLSRGNINLEELDATIKKNQAIIKKLKTINDTNRLAIEADIDATNISQFIPEFAQSIAEANYKLSSVKAVISVCSKIHRIYAEFSSFLNQRMKNTISENLEKFMSLAECVSELRNVFRLYCELFFCGVISKYTNLQYIMEILQKIVKSDQHFQNGPAIVSAVLKECFDALGIFPDGFISQFADVNDHLSELLTISQKGGVRKFFVSYYASLCESLLDFHTKIEKIHSKTTELYALRGDLPSELKEKYERWNKRYDTLYGYVRSLSECLSEPLPSLEDPYNASLEIDSSANKLVESSKNEQTSNIWGDDETKYFYENFVDISKHTTDALEPKDISYNEWVRQLSNQKTNKSLPSKFQSHTSKANNFEDSDDGVDELIAESHEDIVISKEEKTLIPFGSNEFFSKLTNCVNREFVDQIAIDFVSTQNTKVVRKVLVQELYHVKFTRLDLLPFYGRLVATLHPYYPEIGYRLVFLLKKQVAFYVKQRLHFNLESKIRSIRFLGELTKFKICPKSDCLWILKHLLADFFHHNIHMICNLLDSCGSFLYASPEARKALTNILDQLKRKAQLAVLDEYLKMTIENAICSTCSSEMVKVKEAKCRSNLDLFLTKLLRHDLSKHSVESILKIVRKLDYSQENITRRFKNLAVKVWKIKFSNIPWLANLLSGLVIYQPSFVHDVIDYVVEFIRVYLEMNESLYHQKIYSATKLLGEFYAFNLVETDVIFRTCYLFIALGYLPDGTPEFDDPSDFFRIRLVLCLLETAYRYFDDSVDQQKLTQFMKFFQAYIWIKRVYFGYTLLSQRQLSKSVLKLPNDIEFLLEDMVESIKFNGIYYNTMHETQLAISDCFKSPESSMFTSAANDMIYHISWLSVFMMLNEESLSKIATDTLQDNGSQSSTSSAKDIKKPQSSEGIECASQSSSLSKDDETEFLKQLDSFIKENQTHRASLGATSMNQDLNPSMSSSLQKEKNIGQAGLSSQLLLSATEVLLKTKSGNKPDSQKNSSLSVLNSSEILDLGKNDTVPDSGNLKGNKDKLTENTMFNLRILNKKSNRNVFHSVKIPKDSQIASKILHNQMLEARQKDELKQVILNMSSRFNSNTEFSNSNSPRKEDATTKKA